MILIIYIFVFEFLSIIKCSSSFQILEHLAGKTGYGTVFSRFPDDINLKCWEILQAKNPTKHRFQKECQGRPRSRIILPVISLQFYLEQLFRKVIAIECFLLFLLIIFVKMPSPPRV